MKTEWEKVTLGDVVKITSGNTPSKENANFWNGEFPWISAKDMKTKYLSDSILKLSKTGFDVANKAPVNSLVVLTRGMTLHTDVPICLVKKQLAFNQDVKCLIPNTTINSEYLYYYLQNNKRDLLNLVDSAGNGTGRLDSEILKDMEICFPSPEEQINISDTLSTWDSAIEKTEKLIFEKEKKLQWIIIHYFENAEKNKNWIVSKLSEFLKPGDKNPVENTANYRKITIKLHKNGIEYINSQRRMVDTRPFYIRRAGELIIGKQNYFNGSIALLEKDFDGAICSNAIMSFSIAKSINPDFLLEAISTKKYLREKSVYANGTGQKELSENVFLSFDVKLPSLKVQNEIMEIVNLQKSEISLLKKQLEQYKLQKQGLMQKLLTGEWRVR